jgi:hypothetical protein
LLNKNVSSGLAQIELREVPVDLTRLEFASLMPILSGVVWLGLKPFA